MKRTFARPNKLFNSLPNYKQKPDFPSLANEIAKPRPDMNIKVAAFAVSKKSINKFILNSYLASSDFCLLLVTFANSLDPEMRT